MSLRRFVVMLTAGVATAAVCAAETPVLGFHDDNKMIISFLNPLESGQRAYFYLTSIDEGALVPHGMFLVFAPEAGVWRHKSRPPVNLKDIEAISASGDQRTATIALRDGTTQKMLAGQVRLQWCAQGYPCDWASDYSTGTLDSGYSESRMLAGSRYASANIQLNERLFFLKGMTLTFLEGDEFTRVSKLRADYWAGLGEQERAARVASQQRAEEAAAAAKSREAALESEAEAMRRGVKIGTQTNCGPVFDIRLPLVGVQTSVGMQFIMLSRLYGPGAGCALLNGQYVGRTN
jgi:hypothetical protein